MKETAIKHTGVVDFNDTKRNLYGCLPCPKCGSKFRAAYRRSGKVECDECGHKEPAVFKEDAP